ncbi:MAG TPA: isochorismatase family protein [Dongiaceae bacterium]|nr:isochorismatase family protein [Dongiaceae bacterium]
MDRSHDLLERDRSCLVVIDVQQYFLDKLPLDQRQPLVARIAWLMRVARILDIPIIATAEDISANGSLVPDLLKELPAEATVFDKMIFGLCGQPDIRSAVEATGRRDFVLAGLETDVCVGQSAIGLLGLGYRVGVIEDATASPPPHHASGIARLQTAGAIISALKGVYYEWVRDLATHERVQSQLNRPLPPGLTL